MKKAECLAKAEDVLEEAIKAATAWQLCGHPEKAQEEFGRAYEEARTYRFLASMTATERRRWIVKNWTPKH